MTTDIVQMNEDGEVREVKTEANPVDVSNTSDTSIVIHNAPETGSATESLQTFQAKMTTFLADATTYTTTFFNNNRRLLTTLGWIVLAFLGVRLVFGALDALDDVPLVAPILELIGFVYVVRFVWHHLIRETDRQELLQRLNRAKSEVLGS